MWFTNLKWGLSEAQWCPLPAPARLPHNKIVIENSQEGNDHLVSMLRPSAVRLLLAAGTLIALHTAQWKLWCALCPLSSTAFKYHWVWSGVTDDPLVATVYTGMKLIVMHLKQEEQTMCNGQYSICGMMVIMRVKSGGGAGVALVDINGLINMS